MDEAVKEYKSYEDQVELLAQRGMEVGERPNAVSKLRRVNYYRLSGYWYPFRRQTPEGRQAATELMDWGSLTYLYSFAPRHVQDVVADACGLSAPQLTSWLKSLNLVRSTCAHHGRLSLIAYTPLHRSCHESAGTLI